MTRIGTENIRVLIVDDEAPARQRLRDLLAGQPGISISEASDGTLAIQAIRAGDFALLFLDVQMPESDGFDVIGQVGSQAMPLTIFVTAYDEYAVQAFEANAIDYLLKPFSDERFETAMNRARQRLVEKESAEFRKRLARLVSAPAEVTHELGAMDRLVIKADGRVRFLALSDLYWVEATGVYVTLHTAGGEMLVRLSLSELEARLDPRRFIRIHRSTIVSLDRITQLDPLTHGDFQVTLKGGATVRLSRSYRWPLEQRLGQSL